MEALEKFMDAMGIVARVEVAKDYYSVPLKNKIVCVEVSVSREGKQEYLQYHCYTKRVGHIRYVEGNEVKGIHQGVLAYLGMDKEIDDYFDNKARELAEKHL